MHRDYLQNNLSEVRTNSRIQEEKAFIPINKAFCDEIKITAYVCSLHIFP